MSWINDQLKLRNDDAANVLQVQVLTALRRARQPDLLDAVLANVALKAADRRSLHRYKVSYDIYEGLRREVGRRLRLGDLRGDLRGSAHFVLFVSEWFRREYVGGQQRWEDIAAALAAPLPQADTRPLTQAGLRWWGRLPRTVNGVEERLLSLALEGGFPVRVLEGEQGWLLDFLRRAVGRLSSVPGEGEVAALLAVQAVEPRIPASFRGGEFQQLSAELVSAVGALRREAQRLEPRGLPLSLRLDAARPGWREDLPVRLEGEGARKLVDELISTTPDRLSGDARCRRLLLPAEDGGWRPALELSLSGELSLPSALRGHEGRVRVSAAGALAARLSGEIALLEPPGEESAWLARPRGAAKRMLEPYPFDAPVEVELRRDGAPPVRAKWPRGEGERSDLLVFAEMEDAARPGALALVGPGSCRSRHLVLYAWAPASFVAHAFSGAPLAPVWMDGDRALFRLEAPARVASPGADYAYRIEPGAGSDRVERLAVEGEPVRGLQNADAGAVYAGAPRIRGRSNGLLREVDSELSWRRGGEGAWRSMREPMEGAVELIWRDPASRSLRDRTSFVVLPAGARLRRQGAGERTARLMLADAPDWTLESVEAADLKAQPAEGGLELTFVGPPARTVPLQLTHPRYGTAAVRTAFPTTRGGFARADGRLFRRSEHVMLDALRGAHAFAPARGSLTLELHGRPSSRQTQTFDEELPLASALDDVARILSGADDLDAYVILTVDPGGDCLCVGRYVGQVDYEAQGRTVSVRGVAAVEGRVRYEWRSFIDPSPAGLQLICERDGLGGAPPPLPDDLIGPGLGILRVDGVAVARPAPVSGKPIVVDGLDPLVRASTVAGSQARRTAVLDALKEVGDAAAPVPALRWMHEMLAALDGVPPIALDIFRLLWRRPAAAAALLLSAESDAERERAWRLEQTTCLIWALTPIDAWRAALAQRLTHFINLLERAGLPDTMPLALAQLQREGEAVAGLDHLLRAPLAAVKACRAEPAARPHFEIAQDRVRRSPTNISRSQEQAIWRDCFYDDESVRPRLPELFQQRERFHSAHYEGMAAPCAAALSVAGRLDAPLTESQRLRVRDAMSEDPLHFAEAYAAFLAEFTSSTSARAA